MVQPLVSIICLSYNHAPYIREALDSVLKQTYPNIEVIVIDDASQDGSGAVILEFVNRFPHIKFIPLRTNVGNCKAFNLGYKASKGEYIIDFALDDILLPTRVERQIQAFTNLTPEYGVVFSDVGLIDKNSRPIGNHYKRDRNGTLLEEVPTGNIYKEILEKYFISPPSMMIKREVLDQLGGYDESLAYEDFDFWVRSARTFYYYFMDEIQTLKRVLPGSHGSKFNNKREHFMQESTLRVCEKAFHLNHSKEENLALAKRIKFHLRQSLFTENYELVDDFFQLLARLNEPSLTEKMYRTFAHHRLPVFWLYRMFR